MTQDFAKPSTTRKPGQAKKKNGHADRPKPRDTQAKSRRKNMSTAEQPAAPKKRKLFFGASLLLLLCAFAYGLYLLQGVPETYSIKEDAVHIKPKKAVEKKETAPEAVKNRFNFYDLLPNHQVVAPKVDAYQYREKNASEAFYYMIQTGSFRNLKDAERQKAMIAFQGLKADIKSVTNDQGTTWHRVTTGPFYNRSKMNGALDKLVSMQIQPLVKKVKKSS